MPKLLLLAPTFFPDPSTGGIRVTQWAKYLPEFHWEPRVFCRHHGYTATPKIIAEQLHPAVEVHYLGLQREAPASPAAGRKAGSRGLRRVIQEWVIEPVSVPDLLIWKWRSLRREALERARSLRPDVVLSSSPHHSIHDLGAWLAQQLAVPWVADFRDPNLIDVRSQPTGMRRLRARAHHRFERRIYEQAALCIHAIPLHGRWASRHYPFARDKIRILTNGIPPELLDEEFLHSAERSPRVSIRAAGVLGHGALDTLQIVLRQLLATGYDAEFRHVGRPADGDRRIAAELRDRVVLRGRVSHREALREIAGADVLLKFDDLERAKVNGLSSKLFEYLATGRPIVAVNPTRPDWQLLRRLSWCWCLRNPQPTEIADALRQAITGRAQPSEAWLTAFRQQYNRRNQTQQLAQWLDELVV